MLRARALLTLAVAVCAMISGCSRHDEPSTAHLTRAAEFLGKGKQRAASKEISAAIKADPARLETYTTAIALYSNEKRYAYAARIGDVLLDRVRSGDLDRKLSKEERASTYSMLGIVYQEASDLPKAESAYKLALKIAPDSPSLLNNLGWFYADEGIKLTDALKLTNQATMLAPHDGNILDSLGWAQFKLGHYDAAVRTMKRAVVLEPDTAELRYHLGTVYTKLGMSIEARIELNKALILDPNITEASILLKTLQF
ncbi:MAG: tetratricopeptide repeat protein [Armatimonadota bacterium]